MNTINTISIEEFKKRVVKSFSTRAAAYEAHAQVQSLAALLLSEFIAESQSGELAALVPAKGPILEIGCGTGFLSAHLLSHFPGREIVISDISQDMLELCKARLSRCPGFDPARVTFAVLDGEDLQADTPYAAIFSNFALQWFGRPATGIANMREALADGGCIFFAVPGEETFAQWKALCQESCVPFTGNPLPSGAELTSWANDASLTVTLREYLVDHHYPDVHSMLKALKESGTSTRRTENGLTVSELRRLLRAGRPDVTCAVVPAIGDGSEIGSMANAIEISYHILYGCMTK